MKTIRLFFAFVLITSVLRGDRDTTPIIPRAIASTGGAYFLLVVPVTAKRDSWIWTVYSMGETGAFKEVWSRDGVYSREMFLADDGRHVVCVESWPSGHAPKNDFVITVYDEGTLSKAYRPTDLIRDPLRIQHSVSHYRWLADAAPLFVSRGILHFTTVEGTAFEMEMTTGKILGL